MYKRALHFAFIILTLVLLCSCGTAPSSPAKNDELSGNDTVLSGDVNSEAESSSSGTFNPFSKEFSLQVNGQTLGLGQQSGNFPWGTDLQEKESNFWNTDGFDCFKIACEDGTVLSGLRKDGMDDATDGMIFSIATKNPSWQTYRGAYVGMSLQDVLALYPEAIHRDNTDPGENSYSYTSNSSGFSEIIFYFENDGLVSIIIKNSIDG